MTEYKVIVIEEADKQTMLKEQFRLENMGNDEWLMHQEVNHIYSELDKINEWKRYNSKCGNGYRNRER